MVHFVGAGSGAPDLITLRGKRFLEHDNLGADLARCVCRQHGIVCGLPHQGIPWRICRYAGCSVAVACHHHRGSDVLLSDVEKSDSGSHLFGYTSLCGGPDTGAIGQDGEVGGAEAESCMDTCSGSGGGLHLLCVARLRHSAGWIRWTFLGHGVLSFHSERR